jgi:hypothetical protein
VYTDSVNVDSYLISTAATRSVDWWHSQLVSRQALYVCRCCCCRARNNTEMSIFQNRSSLSSLHAKRDDASNLLRCTYCRSTSISSICDGLSVKRVDVGLCLCSRPSSRCFRSPLACPMFCCRVVGMPTKRFPTTFSAHLTAVISPLETAKMSDSCRVCPVFTACCTTW